MINSVSFASRKVESKKLNKKSDSKNNPKSKAITCTTGLLGLAALGVAAFVCVKRHKKPTNDMPLNPFAKARLLLEDKHANMKLLEDKMARKPIVFLNSSGEIAENVELRKGMAFKNHSPFSGTMKVSIKDNDFEILYKNGKLSRSYKNGKLFKEYASDCINSGSRGDYAPVYLKTVSIFDESGAEIKKRTLNYGHQPFEKPKRTISWNYEQGYTSAQDFDSKGNIIAKSLYSSPRQPILLRQETYNDKGKILSSLKRVKENIYEKSDLQNGKVSLVKIDFPYAVSVEQSSIPKTKPAFIQSINKFGQDLKDKLSNFLNNL